MIGGGKKKKGITKRTTKRKVNKNMTKRLKDAILKKAVSFLRTSKWLVAHREGYRL